MSAVEMNQYQVMDERRVKINRIKLVAIFAVAVVPVALAMAMYFGGFAVPSAKTNKGNLIWPPIHVDSLNSASQMANQLVISDSILASKKWTLLITGSNECDKACRDLIHTVRQVNVSMAKEMDRVSRVVVSTLGTDEIAALESQYPDMVAYQVDRQTVSAFEMTAAENGGVSFDANQWKVWIVDPLGNVVIQYSKQHDGYDMIHDLKKLLKLSNIG